ncbi:CHD5-like protein-domain-containing protein [Vararia minispora EC-137]|uniref:CHD5-like protein-domain-containing protein n=1 Tax=Vararia minispora EC-137 TaxID=1314806 RepID=A0ACB8QZG0_9AGAM|nr:CHD5-like protein-domain-containing protein [Vararia minispora EC-137]
MNLILTIFLFVLLNEFVAWIGKSVLQRFAWGLYQRVFYSGVATNQRKLKIEVLEKKKELLQTSAQDQFSKWAKLRRAVDKGLADLEKLNKQSNTARASFEGNFGMLLWFVTTGVQLVIGWWYRSAAVFYLPPTWLGPLTWWLAFPFAPAGSVSCGVWQMACRRVIRVGERTVRNFLSNDAATSANTAPTAEASTKTGPSGRPMSVKRDS